MKFNVVTPLARFENLPRLKESLKQHDVVWHIITDNDSNYIHTLDGSWINHYECPNEGLDFWVRCHNSLNWFFHTQNIQAEEYYCVLNDDDAYEDEFFQKVKYQVEANSIITDVLICSMLRGHHTPTDVDPVRHHPTDTLIAHPANVRVGSVGLEQFIAKGKVLKDINIPLTACGDGEFITALVSNNNTAYLSDCYIKFNYLQPGRWHI